MGLTDKNLFAYCDNNPVMREDKGGQFWNIIAGAVIGGGLELAGQLLSGKSLSEVNWAKVGVSAVSGGLTAAVGPVAGCLISGATDVAMDALDGNINSVADAAKSFAWGTAKAVVSYGVGTAVGKATKSLTKIEKVGRLGEDGFPGINIHITKVKVELLDLLNCIQITTITEFICKGTNGIPKRETAEDIFLGGQDGGNCVQKLS